jgi:hypothetical protein
MNKGSNFSTSPTPFVLFFVLMLDILVGARYLVGVSLWL